MSRKCFVDCGAFTGDTCNLFLEHPEVFGVEDPDGYDLYAFEPGKQHWDFHQPERVTLINQAVWVADEQRNYVGGAGNQAATIVIDPEVLRGRPVECVDFDAWLRQFEGYEAVLVKMDIEGAEFPVLERLLETGTLRLITGLFVEFHFNRCADAAERRLALLEGIKRAGVPFREW